MSRLDSITLHKGSLRELKRNNIQSSLESDRRVMAIIDLRSRLNKAKSLWMSTSWMRGRNTKGQVIKNRLIITKEWISMSLRPKIKDRILSCPNGHQNMRPTNLRGRSKADTNKGINSSWNQSSINRELRGIRPRHELRGSRKLPKLRSRHLV